MNCTPFRVFLLLIGIFSLGFQIVGLFVPAWYRMEMEVESNDGERTEIDVSIGLFIASSCVRSYGVPEICNTASMASVRRQMSNDNVQFADLTVIKIMAIAGFALTCLGFSFSFMYLRGEGDKQKCKGIIAGLGLGLGALILMVAFGIHIRRYFDMLRGVELLKSLSITEFTMEVSFPWAALFTGLGALLAIVAGLAVSIRMCKSSREPYEGYTAQYKA